MRQSSRPRRFDWPAARHPGCYETRPRTSELSAGGPPAELFPNWEDRGRVATNPTRRSLRSSPPLCLAVGGH
jgi:hypothetical protein